MQIIFSVLVINISILLISTHTRIKAGTQGGNQVYEQ